LQFWQGLLYGLLYELFFITDSIQGMVIIEPTKKTVAIYTVGNLTLMNL